MNLLRILTVLASVVFATASATAPAKHNVQKSAKIGHDYDTTWAAVIDVFSDRGWAIANMEKDSGLITTDWMNLGDDESNVADCGSAPLAAFKVTQVRFNVRVKGGDGGSSVTVNTKFRQERKFDSTSQSAIVDCESTGLIEGEIQQAVNTVAIGSAPRKKKAAPVVTPVAATALRGWYCANAPGGGFCLRDKADCVRSREIAASPDLGECALSERAFCFGERCAPTAEACDATRARTLGPDGQGAQCAASE